MEIKKSNIKNAGLGLFTKKNIEKNSYITEFPGKIVNNTEYNLLQNNNDIDALDYALRLGKMKYLYQIENFEIQQKLDIYRMMLDVYYIHFLKVLHRNFLFYRKVLFLVQLLL